MKIIQEIGNKQLQERKTTLFICSKHTPFSLYPVIFDWVESLGGNDCVMCFNATEMEHEVMSALLIREIPTILVVTNRFTDIYNIQIEKAINEGRLLIIVLKREEPKGTGPTPRLRNLFAIERAHKIVSGFINPNGHVFGLLAGRKNVEKLIGKPSNCYAEEQIKTTKRWTVGEDKRLLRMYYEDQGIYAIKKQINRPYLTIRQRINAITIPEEMLKGREFEDYVIEELLQIGKKESKVQLLEWRGDKSLEGVFPEANRLPDLVVSFKRGKKIALECKWRNTIKLPYNQDLFKTEKTEIFKQYSEENNIDVWFVIGVGGEPNAPEEQYLLPLSKASSNSLTMKELSNYQFTGQLTMESFEKEENLDISYSLFKQT